MQGFWFRVLHKDKKTKARVGEIRTPHGVIKTPAFVPVGTQASVKSLTPTELKDIGVQLFFVNTYHMYLRPGIETVEKIGGIHKFMGWDGPIITDSGGFQVFSLGRGKQFARGDENFLDPLLAGKSIFGNARAGMAYPLSDTPGVKLGKRSAKILSPSRVQPVKITDEGVEFRSHWDGSKHVFTPENAMERQWKLGSDIHIAFDDCTAYPVTHAVAKQSMERTHGWAERSLEEHKRLHALNLGSPSRSQSPPGRWQKDSFQVKKEQVLYGSIQGSVYEDLRKESAKFISSMDFDGIAIGGVAVGESKKEMVDVLDWVMPILPEEKPRHLLGVGEIDDIFDLVEHGVDTFDCVQPTRMARVGRVLIGNLQIYKSTNLLMKNYELDITKREFAEDSQPIDTDCSCYTCKNFSRAYLHHLFRVRELLAYRLATYHNLWFFHRLVDDIRDSIRSDTFLELKKQWLYNK